METNAIAKQKTVRASLKCADQIWPHFWKFVTNKEMTEQELLELDRHISTTKEHLKYFHRYITYIFNVDSSEDSAHYFALGIDAIERMYVRIQRIKYQNEQQLKKKYGTNKKSFLRYL